jgi:hypothetical protein
MRCNDEQLVGFEGLDVLSGQSKIKHTFKLSEKMFLIPMWIESALHNQRSPGEQTLI